jgi:hypothetical protein
MGFTAGTLLGRVSVALNVDGATVTAGAARATRALGLGSSAEDRAQLDEERSALLTASKMRLKANLPAAQVAGEHPSKIRKKSEL